VKAWIRAQVKSRDMWWSGTGAGTLRGLRFPLKLINSINCYKIINVTRTFRLMMAFLMGITGVNLRRVARNENKQVPTQPSEPLVVITS
jgi:hypothetical protein